MRICSLSFLKTLYDYIGIYRTIIVKHNLHNINIYVLVLETMLYQCNKI